MISAHTSTSVISFPRSPHQHKQLLLHLPIYVGVVLLVLPEPNGPGIAAVPPLVTAKKVSIILCPVIKGFTD